MAGTRLHQTPSTSNQASSSLRTSHPSQVKNNSPLIQTPSPTLDNSEQSASVTGRFPIRFKRSSSLIKHPSSHPPPIQPENPSPPRVQVEVYGNASIETSPLLPEPVTAPTSPLLEPTTGPPPSTTTANPTNLVRPAHPYGVWDQARREPTSLPPPPRSPSGSAGRKRAEQLRKAASSPFISDLDLDLVGYANQPPVKSRPFRSASVDASNKNASNKHFRWNSSASGRNWDLAEQFNSIGETLDQGRRNSGVNKGKDKENSQSTFGQSGRNKKRSSLIGNQSSATSTKRDSIRLSNSSSDKRLSAFFSRKKQPQSSSTEQSHFRYPTNSSQTSTQRRFSSLISSVQTSRASILSPSDKPTTRTLSSFFRPAKSQVQSSSAPFNSSFIDRSEGPSLPSSSTPGSRFSLNPRTRASASTNSTSQEPSSESASTVVPASTSRISRTLSKLAPRGSKLRSRRDTGSDQVAPSSSTSVSRPNKLKDQASDHSFELVDLEPEEKRLADPPQSTITPITASSATPRATRFSDPGSNAHLRATAQKQQEEETASTSKKRPRPHTEPCGQNCSDREGSGSGESSNSFGRTTQLVSATTNRMSSMSTSTSSVSRRASLSQSSSGRSPSAGIGGSLFSNIPTSRPRRGSAAASTATTVSNQRGATPSSQRGGATSGLPRSIRSADGEMGKPFGISFAEAEQKPVASSRTSIVNHTHAMNNSTPIERSHQASGNTSTTGTPGSRRTAVSLINTRDPRFPDKTERKRTESESRAEKANKIEESSIESDSQ